MESIEHFDKFIWSLRRMGRTKEEVRFRALVEYRSKGQSTTEIVDGRAFANGAEHGKIRLVEGLRMLSSKVKLEFTTRSDRYSFAGDVLSVKGFWVGVPYDLSITAQ